MPGNGGCRWRFSRWLAGGFPLAWLLRRTGPQLAYARRGYLSRSLPYVVTIV